MPITATLVYADGRTEQVLAVASDAVTEVQVPVNGRIRDIRFNEDFGALVRIEKRRPASTVRPSSESSGRTLQVDGLPGRSAMIPHFRAIARNCRLILPKF